MKKSVSGNSKRNRVFTGAGVLLIAASLYLLIPVGREYKKGKDTYEQLETAVLQETKPETAFDYRAVQIDFDALKNVNEDVIGWIHFDDNGISYPVLQGSDNEEYLYTLADKTANRSGSIFMDASCSADFSDSHTIIYGHNMKDLSMFGKLKKYRTDENYYEENRYFTIYTPKQTYRYEIFAWYEAAEDDSVYQVGFRADEEFGAFTDRIIERRYQDTGVAADREDKIITLSTCSSADRRFVVHGKLIASSDAP